MSLNGLKSPPHHPISREIVSHPHKVYSKWEIALIIFVVLVVILMAIVAIITIVYTSDAAGVRKYCPPLTIGSLTLNINDRTIKWYIQYDNSIGTPINLYVNGPILPGMTTAPIYFSLCGYPSSLACDLSVPGVLQGIISELNPGGVPLKPFIEQINSEPSRYYVTINNITQGTLGVLC